MVDIQARTRAQLRTAVGDNLGAYRPGRKGTGGSATAWIDSRFVGDGESTYVGWWVVFTTLVNIGMIRIVDTFDSSAGQFQLRGQTTVTADMNNQAAFFELWEKRYPPDRIHRFLNQAILELTGRAFDPVESLALRLDGTSQRFDIPTGMSMIQNVYYRDSVDSGVIHTCDALFDSNAVTYFKVEKDTQDKKHGNNSLKFTLNNGGDLGAGTFLYDTISSKDISKYDYIEFWVKSSTDTAAGNLKLHLDDGAIIADSTDLETVSIPALSEDTWTFVRAKLTNPELDIAIVSVGLEQDSDLNGSTKYFVWLDDIKVVKNDSAQWERIPRSSWRIDKEDKAIVFDNSVHGISGEAPLKLVGGGKPALLSLAETSDGEISTTEVDDRFVIARATALALAAAGPRSTRGDDVNFHRGQLSFWQREAEMAKRALPFLVDVRHSGA